MERRDRGGWWVAVSEWLASEAAVRDGQRSTQEELWVLPSAEPEQLHQALPCQQGGNAH